MSIKLPKEKEITTSTGKLDTEYCRGWNDCLSSCKVAVAEAKVGELVPLNQEKVHEELQRLDQKMERPGNYYRARHICDIFGTPKPRKVPTVDEIEIELAKSRGELGWCSSKESIIAREQRLKDAQSIHSLLEEGE